MEYAAEEIVNRLVQRFTDDVPTCHLNRTHRRRSQRAGVAHSGAFVKCIPEFFNLKRIRTDEEAFSPILD